MSDSNATASTNPATGAAAPAVTGDDVNAAAVAISRAIKGLAQKIAASTDASQQAALRQSLSDLEDQKAQLAVADLNQAGAAIAAATASLQAVVDGARTDPGDILLGEALEALERLAGKVA